MFHSKVVVLILLFTFFLFYFVVSWDSKVDNFASSLFLLIIIRSGLLAEIRRSVCMLKSHWITLPTQSCIVLCSLASHWSLTDSKFPQVFRTLLSILADLNNVVVWIVFTCPLVSKSSSSLINPWRIVPCAPITIGITVTLTFYCYNSSSSSYRATSTDIPDPL